MKKSLMSHHHIIIFDGLCNFCNSIVNFIIKRDPEGIFVFTPMQGKTAQKLIVEYQMEKTGFDTFLLIKDDRCYLRTDAALEIIKYLTGYWKWFRVFKFIPRLIRDSLYRLFANNRYRIFGKRQSCVVPTSDIKKRFI